MYYHIGQGTSRSNNFKRIYLINGNTLLVLFKNLPFSLLRKYILKIVCSQLADIVLSLMNFKTSFIATIRGKIEAVLLFPVFLISRVKIQKERKVTIGYLEHILSERPE